jgi:pimeloyl-ACP methyl ester carboxylesterase
MVTSVSRDFHIQANGLSLACRSWNANSGLPPIICLHGWLDNLATFDALATELPEYHLIAVDLPGHGRSDHLPVQASYHFLDHVFFIADILEALQLKQPVSIIGHSMGGAAATIFAGIAPEKINRLVLIDSLGPLTAEVDQTTARMKEYLGVRNSARLQKNRPLPSVQVAVETRVKFSVVPSVASDISGIVSYGLEERDGQWHWLHDARLKSPSPWRMTEDQLHDVLKDVKCETLVVRAKDGIVLDEQLWNRRLQRLTNCRQVVLSGHHHLHVSNATEVSQEIRLFLG